MPDTDLTTPETADLVAEWHELRGEFGTAIADANLPTEERQAAEARLQALDLELIRRKARPRRISKASPFARPRRLTKARRGLR